MCPLFITQLIGVKNQTAEPGYSAPMKPTKSANCNRSRSKLRRDLKTLALFTAIYCREHHQDKKHPFMPANLPFGKQELSRHSYCAACRELLTYAIDRLQRCPLKPKPACSKCPHNCYAQEQRAAIRKVMAFSGPYLVKRGRFDLLWTLHSG